MKKPIFKRLQTAPLDQRVTSMDACVYYYRVAFFMGWMPPKEGWQRWIYSLWTCITMLLGLIYLPLGLCLTYVVHFDQFTPNEFLTSVQVAFNCIGNVIKGCMIFSQMWRLRRMNELIAPLDERCVTASQKKILHEMVVFVNRIIVFFLCTYLGFTTLVLFSSVFVGKAPWQVYNPYVDWRQGTWQLWVASVLEFILVSMGTMQELLSDTYAIVFLCQFRGHLAILRDRLKVLRTNSELSEEENYEQLVECIQDHRTIVKCSEVMRPLLSTTIFAQFMMVGVDLGLAVFNIMFFANTIWLIISNVFFIVAICTESFPCCMLCELLIEDCANLAHAIFHSNWINADKRYKSALMYFLHRAQKPIEFKAGAIFSISMQSNIAMAKFAFSIITVIKQMNLDEKFINNRVTE